MGKLDRRCRAGYILAGFYPDPSICRVGEDYYHLCESIDRVRPVVQLFRSGDTTRGEHETVLLASQGLESPSARNRITLRIDACSDMYRFSYRAAGGVWAALRTALMRLFSVQKLWVALSDAWSRCMRRRTVNLPARRRRTIGLNTHTETTSIDSFPRE